MWPSPARRRRDGARVLPPPPLPPRLRRRVLPAAGRVLVLVLVSAAAAAARVAPPLATVPTQYLIVTRRVDPSPRADFLTRALGRDFDARVVAGGHDSAAGDTDDTPVDRVPLPFPFYFFGERHLNAWINPNGAVQFDAVPPCGCCFYAMYNTGPCDFNSSYHNMIAAAVTDLLPLELNDSHVRHAPLTTGPSSSSSSSYSSPSGNASSSSSATTLRDPGYGVAFIDVATFGALPQPGPLYSFGLQLRASGRVTVAYRDVFDTRVARTDAVLAPHVAESWLVGLRAPKAYSDTLLAADASKEAFWLSSAAAYGWTSVRGAYPPANLVGTDGTVVDYCPAPTTVCLEPARVQAGTGAQITLAGSAPWGCALPTDDDQALYPSGESAYYCRFGGSVNNGILMPASLVPGSDGRTLACATPTGGQSVGTVNVDVVYYGSAGSFQQSTPVVGDLVVVPLAAQLRVELTAAAPSGDAAATCAASSSSSSSVGNDTDRCDTCGRCSGGSGLSPAPSAAAASNASSSSASSAPTPFTCPVPCDPSDVNSRRDCAGTCNGPAVVGAGGVCCVSAAFLDCNGICNGTFVTAIVQYPTTVAKGCCAAENVDCTGMCHGSARLDDCGQCAGGTTGRVPNAGMDCLGLCPDDPRKTPGVDISCDPVVDVDRSRIDFEVTHDADPDDLRVVVPVKVENKGALRVFLADVRLTHRYADPARQLGATAPAVEVAFNATAADPADQSSDTAASTWTIPSRTSVVIEVTIDLRPALTAPIDKLPLREKELRFEYSYNKAQPYSIVIPINVSGFLVFVVVVVGRWRWWCLSLLLAPALDSSRFPPPLSIFLLSLVERLRAGCRQRLHRHHLAGAVRERAWVHVLPGQPHRVHPTSQRPQVSVSEHRAGIGVPGTDDRSVRPGMDDRKLSLV